MARAKRGGGRKSFGEELVEALVETLVELLPGGAVDSEVSGEEFDGFARHILEVRLLRAGHQS
jgi:hypothetical protein